MLRHGLARHGGPDPLRAPLQQRHAEILLQQPQPRGGGGGAMPHAPAALVTLPSRKVASRMSSVTQSGRGRIA